MLSFFCLLQQILNIMGASSWTKSPHNYCQKVPMLHFGTLGQSRSSYPRQQYGTVGSLYYQCGSTLLAFWGPHGPILLAIQESLVTVTLAIWGHGGPKVGGLLHISWIPGSIWTGGSKYFETFGPPLKNLDPSSLTWSRGHTSLFSARPLRVQSLCSKKYSWLTRLLYLRNVPSNSV